MSQTQQETAELIVKYVKEALGRDTTVAQVLSHPWHKVVGYSWVANTYFKLHSFYKSLEEVIDPYEGMSVKILINAERIDNYFWKKGKWVFNSEITINMYKE